MSTVAQAIDRLKRDWLYGPDSQPTRFTLAASITTTSQTSISYSDALLSSEGLALLGPGTLIECESEEMIVEDVNESTNTITVAIRGANGTTPATHTTVGTEILITPTWRRKAIFDAIADEVELLFPDLYKVTTSDSMTFNVGNYTEVPAAVHEPMYLWARPPGGGSTSYEKYVPVFKDHFPPSSTGKAIELSGEAGSVSGYLVYKSKFTRPSAEATELTTGCGLEDEWERIVLVSAVASLIQGKELDQVDQERLTDMLAQQGFPVLTATRIRQSLLQYRDQLLAKAKDALRDRERTLVTVSYGF